MSMHRERVNGMSAAISQCGDGKHVFEVNDGVRWGGSPCQCRGEYLTYVTRQAPESVRREVLAAMVSDEPRDAGLPQ